jgi:hypothetical protein
MTIQQQHHIVVVVTALLLSGVWGWGRDCRDSCRPLESTDDCEVAAWWPNSAGERLIVELLRRGGEEGGEDAPPGVPPEWDTDATSAEARPMVLRLGETGAADVLMVELRCQSRRLRPLAVEVMLTESESRTRSGVRNCAVSESG